MYKTIAFKIGILIVGFAILTQCVRKKNSTFSYHHHGYYYKLLSFDEEGLTQNKWKIAHLSVVFKTQADSVFWDSYNNLNDNFFVRLDSNEAAGHLDKCFARYKSNDSVCVLIKTTDFYKEQFNLSQIPYFSLNDTVVKVYFKVREQLSENEFQKIKEDNTKKETGRLIAYFGSKQDVDFATDSAGFYWVERPDSLVNTCVFENGDLINITYQGSFLNGRLLENKPQNFDLVFGTPDQLLKGLNYVIRRLKVGQNAKIVLPSRLAFGEKGSCNGTIPPFTPLVYDIRINNLTRK
ncbi:MAG: FKBP-type peptidyl-prolyl cis-trans isomerase [Bacteroidia bacterium]|nr:FKBP-type peptidyl-prolyl cis-trans isomerase [Bacteroidia bacterium]